MTMATSRARRTARRTLASLGFAAIIVAGLRGARRRGDDAPGHRDRLPQGRPNRRRARRRSRSVPDCGTEPVKLNIYHETISELMPQLSAEFTKQYPNVTFDLKSDAFANATANLPRLLSGDNPPDISRAAQLIDLAKDGLLLNLDPYATAYGWDAVAAGPVRIRPHQRATSSAARGSIIAWPVNPSTVGVFYNKDLAAQIGMTEPPKTVEEFDALLAKAKDGRAAADHGVERIDERRRPGLPAPEPDGRLRRPREDQ